MKFLGVDGIDHRLAHRRMRLEMVGILPEPLQARRVEQAVEMLVADLEVFHFCSLRSLITEPRAAMPPSMVTMVPVI